jgi:acyl-CoA synthetase (AMP-forming)/AMP-acid ligase II
MVSGPELPYVPSMPAVVRRASDLFGDDDFIVMPDRRISFRDAEAASRHLAKQLLAAGVGKGTRVGMHLPTGPEWAIAWLAIARVGAVAMPFSTLYRPPELQTAMRIGDVSLLLAQTTMLGKDEAVYLEEAIPGLASSARDHLRVPELPYLRSVRLVGDTDRPWAGSFCCSPEHANDVIDGFDDALLEAAENQVAPGDDLLVVFTSGTSADPKAVVHTHGAILRKTARQADAALDSIFPGRVLSVMPFFWVGGIQMVSGALQSGATVLTLERIEPAAAIELARLERATSVMGNPAVLRAVLGASAVGERVSVPSLTSLQPLPKRPWEGSPSSTGDQPVGLGMTETMGPWAAVDGFECLVIDPESGKELPEGEQGEFHVRGYGLMRGFYKREREDTFTADGYFPTGDLGYVEKGWVYFKGRRTEMIKTKGANVAPVEVEAALNSFSGVKVSFVMARPHDEFGEEVVAAVVPAEGQLIDIPQLLQHVRRVISSYKVPTHVELIADSDISWLPSGKPNKRALGSLLALRRGQSGETGG